jgi:antitoxin ParD1/3/4
MKIVGREKEHKRGYWGHPMVLLSRENWYNYFQIIDNLWDTCYIRFKIWKGDNRNGEGVNVRIMGKLRRFIEEQAIPNGLYESAGEYVRDLIRRDYQRQEERKWSWLMDQLRPGMEADESEFVPLDPKEIIKAAKKEKVGSAS